MSTITTSAKGRSWSGTVDYGPGELYSPTSMEQLQDLVARTPRIRALGTRHSFSTVAASDADLVSLHAMPADMDFDTDACTVRVGGGVRYGELAQAAAEAGLMLPNFGSLPHISAAGASSTGTHGSGVTNPALAAGVRAITLVTAEGDIVELSREKDPDIFGGSVLALGSLGVMSHLVLDIVPVYEARQVVYLDLPAEQMTNETLLPLMGSSFSVSLFLNFDGHAAQVWVKQKVQADGSAADGSDTVPTDATSPFPDTLYGATRATSHRHPADEPAEACTDQSGLPGPALERMPHFRLEFTPSSGAEVQTEYWLPLENLAARPGRAERDLPEDSTAADRLRDPLGRCRRAVALTRTPPCHRLRALHLEAGARGRRGAAARGRGCSGAVRGQAALGQGPHVLPRGPGAPLSADGGLPGAAGAHGSEGQVRQRVRGPPDRTMNDVTRGLQMKAPTVATLYPRHGDFMRLQERLDPRGAAPTSGCRPMCSAMAELSSHRSST